MGPRWYRVAHTDVQRGLTRLEASAMFPGPYYVLSVRPPRLYGRARLPGQ